LDETVDLWSVQVVAAVALLRCAVAGRRNVQISGDQSLKRTLAATIPDTDRIALIEKTSEIVFGKLNYMH
jgi:hypothetical protein